MKFATVSPNAPAVQSSRVDPARRARRRARYEQVMALRKLGWTHAAIAAQTGVSQRTLVRWLATDSFPERKSRTRPPSPWLPHADYLRQRWADGCHNATQLWREVCHQGYSGPRSAIWEIGQRLRRGAEAFPAQAAMPAAPAALALTPGRVVVLLLQHREQRRADEQELLERVLAASPALTQAGTLCADFLRVLRERLPDELTAWLHKASHCGLSALERFARGLQRDVAAVRAAGRLPYSNGQAEGQITRLKLIKRRMYGRAKLDLLERRVLHRAAA